jgi:hypothetical protein
MDDNLGDKMIEVCGFDSLSSSILDKSSDPSHVQELWMLSCHLHVLYSKATCCQY